MISIYQLRNTSRHIGYGPTTDLANATAAFLDISDRGYCSALLKDTSNGMLIANP